MVNGIRVGSVLRVGESRLVNKLMKVVGVVNSLEEDVRGMTDAELRGMTDVLRRRVRVEGESVDVVLPEAFAVVREAAVRAIGQRPYDVQLLGGAVLQAGNIAEMQTGEGKTLVATLPAYVHALAGKGVHVVTVNDYLAQRDAEWMGRVHEFLGVSVGCVTSSASTEMRKRAYAADITYGTNNEFGFDYLRDNMVTVLEDRVQRGHHFALVDEVDSILIDEARTPLIISGPAEDTSRWYDIFARLVTNFEEGRDYTVDVATRRVAILEPGIDQAEDVLGLEDLYVGEYTNVVGHLMNAVKAKELYHRNREYVVTPKKEVVIVDEHTGRPLEGRRYTEGMHQAIEAKENVPLQPETQTWASVTLQNYFRKYSILAGMTGTASSETLEFRDTYHLNVVPIPTHKESRRVDRKDVVYRTEVSKFRAVVDDIKEKHEYGQPVLVGTTSVKKSEYLSSLLTQAGIRHNVLNAKSDDAEAGIVAEAGHKYAVTVSTNMAGRGTDIMLGGNPDYIATTRLQKRGIFPPTHVGKIPPSARRVPSDEYAQLYAEETAIAKTEVELEHDEVTELGGLYVIGTERHESRRIDNQLRGRSGRQGDPGETRFYVSFEDVLIKKFNLRTAENILTKLNPPDDAPIQSRIADTLIRNAQGHMEMQHFNIRRDVVKYDNVMNTQREIVYRERLNVLTHTNPLPHLLTMSDDALTHLIALHTTGYPEEWQYDNIVEDLQQLYPTTLTPARLKEVVPHDTGTPHGTAVAALTTAIHHDFEHMYTNMVERYGTETMQHLTRHAFLTAIDTEWKNHLHEVDYLKAGINLRRFAQKDPFVEYQQETSVLFSLMMEIVKEATISTVFLTPPTAVNAIHPAAPHFMPTPLPQNLAPTALTAALPTPDTDPVTATAEVNIPEVNIPEGTARNAPCPCGSGRKYKRCHGNPDQEKHLPTVL